MFFPASETQQFELDVDALLNDYFYLDKTLKDGDACFKKLVNNGQGIFF